MSEPSREYIECRIFILGDEKVGKKSFVNKIINLPCTSEIRNVEAEEEYNKLYSHMKEQMEQEKMRQEQQEALLKSINDETKSKNEDFTSKFTSTRTLFKIEEEKRTFSRKPSINLNNVNDKTNRNITTSNNIQMTNNSSGIINPSSLGNKKIFRFPVPEYPAKLYCVNFNKIVIKIFCIPKAEKQPSDFIPRDDDEEYELEKEHNISFDGIRRDLNEKLGIKDTVISQDKLNGFNTSIFTLFVFLYDLSNFYSFESLILYYSKIAKIYHLGEEENFKACIVGNKKDKKVNLEKDQVNIYNEFLKNTQLKKFEVSTKPYFVFDNFFINFFLQSFSMFNQNQNQTQTEMPIQNTKESHKLLEDIHFIEQFKKIVKNKSNFSRSERSTLIQSSFSPGPEYNLNLYSFNSIEEIKEIFSNKKSRFNKKIFTNKSGPIISSERISKELINKNKDKDIVYNIAIKGGLFNKPISGYSFGIVKGKLNLLDKRKELRNKRYNDLQENINSYNQSPINKKPLKQSKDEDYFANVLKRKNNLYDSVIKERQLKVSKIMALHHENLKKIEIKKEISRNKVFKNQKINLQKSASSPNILFNSISSIEDVNLERKLNRQRYHDVIYSKNKEHLEKYNNQLSQIRLLSSMRREPEPYFIDVRENMLNPQKGRRILEKFRVVEKKEDAPKYQRIKDDFDKIAEKVNNYRPNYAERFPSTEKERLQKEKENKSFEEYEKKEEEKRQKWEMNRDNSDRVIRMKLLKNEREEKLNKHYQLLKNEEMKREAIQEMRREISIQKGYGDPLVINPINYSLVEESPPKYSIKGRYEVHEIRNDDPGNLVLGANLEKLNYIKEAQKNAPLPNFNYIKRKLPSVVFSKAERFPKQKNQYEDSVLLFEDGIFQPNTHQDFICKEPMENASPRSGIVSSIYNKSPSPAEYKIKSSFDVIAEEGKKKSNIQKKLKLQKSNELKKKESNENNNNMELILQGN